MGCQVRAAREMKKDEAMLTCPRTAMITPDLIANSDAGRAILACCEPLGTGSGTEKYGFWDAFENTAKSEQKYA
eukprot:1028191-Ditylum_brightwellii.AAC.1